MNNWQKTKDKIKYIIKKYLNYDLALRKVKIGDDFQDQKKFLVGKDAKIIFDVGANIGQTTQKYRKIFPKAKIYGFEPFPKIFDIYKKNNVGNKLVYSNQIALSNKIGKASFFTNACHYTNSLLPVNNEHKNDDNYRQESKIEVSTDTLDNFCNVNNIDHIDILKMDVQGGELAVLEGAKELLKSGRIYLVYSEVEFTSLYENQPLFIDIEKILNNHGYKMYKKYNTYLDNKNNPISADVIFYNNSLTSINNEL